MPFITGGYPSLEVTTAAIPALAAAGASILEIGFPFSDPIADGPVISASMTDALASGATIGGLFDAVRLARRVCDVGLVAMASVSIITKIGPDVFAARAVDAGFDGLIVPDLDLAVAPEWAEVCADRGIALALLVAPTSSLVRIATITQLSRGFVYLLARTGVTGERDSNPDIAKSVATIRAATALPIAAGFGVSTPEHVAAVTAHADAAIVGSAIVRRMAGDDPVHGASGFTRRLASGLRVGELSS